MNDLFQFCARLLLILYAPDSFSCPARPAIPCGFGSGFKLGRNCDNSRNKEQLSFYLIRDDSSGTH